jgi:hypothetical protein
MPVTLLRASSADCGLVLIVITAFAQETNRTIGNQSCVASKCGAKEVLEMKGQYDEALLRVPTRVAAAHSVQVSLFLPGGDGFESANIDGRKYRTRWPGT